MTRSTGAEAIAEGAGLLQQLVDQRGLAMVDVGDDGDVANFSITTCASPTPAARSSTSPCPLERGRRGLFDDGKMFDGSSIAGWKGINESDMMLMPEDEHRGAGPVHRRERPDPALRHPRALHHAGLRARPALRGQARRGLPQVHRHR
jgi:hypothetical protein